MDDGFIKMENTKTYTASTSTVTPLLTRPKGVKSFPTTKAFDSFRSGPSHGHAPAIGENGRSYNQKAAAWNTANTILVRRLKGRHLQMIAIGGSIGTGLFIGSGSALATGGPASLLLAFILIGAVLFCTVQALGWNYAMQWAITMPLEVMAAAITLEYWNLNLPSWVAITIFLILIVGINLCGVKVYGEAEYTFSILKVAAVIGFIILGVVINCGGTQDSGYIGGKYWSNPGAFHNGFKGFCNILVTAAFSFSGTELVGLAAAETHNPSKALPTAIKQVFWRIALFYIVSITVVGLLVPYTDERLIGRNNVDSKASPFIIAIQSAGIQGLDSVMNAVVMIAVLSVANSSMYGATRTLQALGEQGQAPRIFAYVDRKGRPMVAIGISSAVGLLAYLYVSSIQGEAFTWLLALSGLSSIFTWCSICYAHIQFRKAWKEQGNLLSDLVYQSPIGEIGSWVGFSALIAILAAQFWVAISPSGASSDRTAGEQAVNFFEAYLAMPVVLLFYAYYKIWYRTKWVRVKDIDLQTGRNEFETVHVRRQWKDDRSEWPRWKVLYKTLC
ncbi:amino acid transporter-like protein [Leptodontidium sp. MPI-SDFR-AT-0119]|nr:amino acid transporter-like protein [Leptodontidium sp. MPI-SDFR-AT-0119]